MLADFIIPDFTSLLDAFIKLFWLLYTHSTSKLTKIINLKHQSKNYNHKYIDKWDVLNLRMLN